jgi:hypothetical protein
VILGNVSIAPGLVVLASFREFIVAERVTNPDDPTQPASYELVRVDIEQRAVVQRTALTGIDSVSTIRHAGGGPRRVLVLGRDLAGDLGHFIADVDTGTVQRLSSPADVGDSEYSTLSPDGRFLVRNWALPGVLQGHDLQNPGAVRTLWTPPVSGLLVYLSSSQFVAGEPATLLVEMIDILNDQMIVYAVPLADVANAREIVRFTRSDGHLRLLVRGDVGIYAESIGGGLSRVRQVRISTGAALGALGPDVTLESLEQFTGNTVLLTTLDGQQRRRGGVIRLSSPTILEPVAPQLEIDFYSLSIDVDETAVGFRSTDAANLTTAYIADRNLLARAVPVTAGVQAGETAALLHVLGPPDP